MKEEDKAHIQLLCQRHNIKWLNDAESVLHCIRSKSYELLHSGSSYSSQLVDKITGEVRERCMYINPTEAYEDLGIGEADDDENEYFVALHEIGHNVIGHRNHDENGDLPREQIEQHEIEAWEWAFAHANYWPSDQTIVRSLCALSTYTHAEHWERMKERLDPACMDLPDAPDFSNLTEILKRMIDSTRDSEQLGTHGSGQAISAEDREKGREKECPAPPAEGIKPEGGQRTLA